MSVNHFYQRMSEIFGFLAAKCSTIGFSEILVTENDPMMAVKLRFKS